MLPDAGRADSLLSPPIGHVERLRFPVGGGERDVNSSRNAPRRRVARGEHRLQGRVPDTAAALRESLAGAPALCRLSPLLPVVARVEFPRPDEADEPGHNRMSRSLRMVRICVIGVICACF